ncbi:MAG TPA: hypothetical protein VGC90_01770 [Candidatus Limnocylindrales bacterium]
MPNRTAPVTRLGAMVGAAVLAIAACGNSSAPSTSAGAASTPAAASSAPAASSDVGSPATSGGAPTIALPSGVLPSDVLPSIPSSHVDPELEAQLPSSLCNQTTTKTSSGGTGALSAAELQILAQLGKSANDVTTAIAGVAGPQCQGMSVIALRIKGADAGQFQQLFLAAEATSTGSPAPQSNVAGKTVWSFSDPSGGDVRYVYFKGDTAFGVTAKNEADAATGLTALP